MQPNDAGKTCLIRAMEHIGHGWHRVNGNLEADPNRLAARAILLNLESQIEGSLWWCLTPWNAVVKAWHQYQTATDADDMVPLTREDLITHTLQECPACGTLQLVTVGSTEPIYCPECCVLAE